jgi:hypothetical protein
MRFKSRVRVRVRFLAVSTCLIHPFPFVPCPSTSLYSPLSYTTSLPSSPPTTNLPYRPSSPRESLRVHISIPSLPLPPRRLRTMLLNHLHDIIPTTLTLLAPGPTLPPFLHHNSLPPRTASSLSPLPSGWIPDLDDFADFRAANGAPAFYANGIDGAAVARSTTKIETLVE